MGSANRTGGTLEMRARRALERGQAQEAVRLVSAWLSEAAAAGQEEESLQAHRLGMVAHMAAYAPDDALALGQEALRIARSLGLRTQEALLLARMAEGHRQKSDAKAAMALLGEVLGALDQVPESAHFAIRAEVALVLSRIGDDERANALYTALLAETPALDPVEAMRFYLHAAHSDWQAGRYARALRIAADAERYAEREGARRLVWPIRTAALLVYLDLGTYDLAREMLARSRLPDDAPGIFRAQYMAFEAVFDLFSGGRPEQVEQKCAEGLAIGPLEIQTRGLLELIRGHALLARGARSAAEQAGIMLAAECTRGGTRGTAAQALGLSALAGPPDAWQPRWLSAVTMAGGGASMRTEYEALCALSEEPEPLGQLVRNALTVCQARFLANTPTELVPRVRTHLELIEERLRRARYVARTGDAPPDDETLRAKQELGLAGGSAVIARTVAMVARAARSNVNLVLTGETGVGKEVFAKLAHRISDRRAGPFVAINCGAIPENLLEAELFGHERGAFTGADRARAGLFVEADGGTLLLDEVGEMSPGMQTKLLRVLEDRQVRALGGDRSRRVDVRVLAATHRDLAELVAKKVFREDLYYRLAAIVVRIPALRERAEDLPHIARALLDRDPQTRPVRLDVAAMAALSEHSWPGNVRELDNVLRAAAALRTGTMIGRPDLTDAILSMRTRSAAHAPPSTLTESTVAAVRARHRTELRSLVDRALAAANGNKLRAAKALGVSRQGLYRLLDESVPPDESDDG